MKRKCLNKRLAGLVMLSVLSVPWVAAAAGNSVVANTKVPTNPDVVAGGFKHYETDWETYQDVFVDGIGIPHSENDTQYDIYQTSNNSIVKWDDFSIGANATVNIYGPNANFNMLNYVTGGNASQIYGKLNSYIEGTDTVTGNIFLVNPNGVQIGNSAQINVGSLYVSNKKLSDIDNWNENTDMLKALQSVKTVSNTELMSLGYINASRLTFEGQRVVIDMDRLSGYDEKNPSSDYLSIVTDKTPSGLASSTDMYDVVLGTSSGKSVGSFEKYINFNTVDGSIQNKKGTDTFVDGGKTVARSFGYRWIRTAEEMQKLAGAVAATDKEAAWSLDDNYALRYAIDFIGSSQVPIGSSADKAFTGKFDGLGNSIFGLNMDNSNKDTASGLFGYTNGAKISNVTLIAGTDGVSIKGGSAYTGSLIGYATNTIVRNVASTLQVTGNNKVGGLIGYMKATDGGYSLLTNAFNTGNVTGVTNVGGLIGSMNGGALGVDSIASASVGASRNMGRVTGTGANVGGLVGSATNGAVIGALAATNATRTTDAAGNGSTQYTYVSSGDAITNYAAVNGKYNVGGIVGSITGGVTVQNVQNQAQVSATGYTTEDYTFHTDYSGYNNQKNPDGTYTISVRMANAGGIVGKSTGSADAANKIGDAINYGDVQTSSETKTQTTTVTKDGISVVHTIDYTVYGAGNVGGIVGSAYNTNISSVTNKESNIRGAMNVGGIAGYFGAQDATSLDAYQNGTRYGISEATNEGGDILATGAIAASGGFAKEATRTDAAGNNEVYYIGNIGGIAGYVDGNMARLHSVNNNGTVHTEYITDADNVPPSSEAANIGGIVGKMDTAGVGDAQSRLNLIKQDEGIAIVSGAVNSGEVQGFANIGGIVGFAYNGSISRSYNSGSVSTSRRDAGGQTPVNMGGVLGDSTEKASGRVVLYDVGNKGTIGSNEANAAGSYIYKGRHVGGVVGRLSGIVEKAYNQGDIYNGSSVVGGIAGYWYAGRLKNVFNTGNITVDNQNDAESQEGGIVGTASIGIGDDSDSANKTYMSITNAYNLGTLRAFYKGSGYANTLGGIVGQVLSWDGNLTKIDISNVYTGGNLYSNNGKVGAIVGWAANHATNGWGYTVNLTNGYFIAPYKDSAFDSRLGTDGKYNGSDSSKLTVNYIANDDKYKKSSWYDEQTKEGFSFSSQEDGKLNIGEGQDWRIYDGSGLPMLNAYLPGAQTYFANSENWSAFKDGNEKGSVQYGTAFNPLLTIVNTQKDLSFDWSELNLGYNGSLAVKGITDGEGNKLNTPYLTLTDVTTDSSTSSYGGTIYSDGQLTILGKGYNDGASTDSDAGTDGEAATDSVSTAGIGSSTDLIFGNESRLYGSSITIKTNGKLELAGTIRATGNEDAEGQGDAAKAKLGVNLEAGELDVYGKITTAKAGETTNPIKGLATIADGSKLNTEEEVKNKNAVLYSSGERYAQAMTHQAKHNGNLNIVTHKNTNADGTTSGQVNLYYGNLGRGVITAYGDLNVTSEGDIFIDSNLTAGGKIKLLAAEGADAIDIQLDLSNIGGDVTGQDKAKAVQGFIDAHSEDETGILAHSNGEEYIGMKVLFDMWDYDANGNSSAYNHTKYDVTTTEYDEQGKETTTTTTLGEKLGALQINGGKNGTQVAYAWIKDATQLNGIQEYAESIEDQKQRKEAMGYRYLLKNDIDASVLGDTYKSIGRDGTAFTGILDGNGKTILGLKAQNGLITTLGDGGYVANLNIYSSVFTGGEGASVGAVAGTVLGSSWYTSIENVTGFGNTVTSSANSIIGGLVGTNGGTIQNVSDQSTVIATSGTTAGGIAGINAYDASNLYEGIIKNAQTISAVTTLMQEEGQYATNLGGIVGINQANNNTYWLSESEITNVSSHGVTGKAGSTKNSGGIVGVNHGNISSAYNESIIHGSENIGGIAGVNETDGVTMDFFEENYVHAVLNDVANGLDIMGDAESTNVGGLVGKQDIVRTEYNKDAEIDVQINMGRNTGTITGGTNVGGMVGYNDKGSNLGNLENAPQATITGDKNVGGIAGYNAGNISSDNDKLLNSGYIYGRENVGGVVGYNVGLVKNVSTDITLHVKNNAENAQNFGGIVGKNDYLRDEEGNIVTDDAGKAVAAGKVINATNNGTVEAANDDSKNGASNVGGIIGYNSVDDAFVDDEGGAETNYVNTGEVIGGNYVGGIIGWNDPDQLANITATNKGKVQATSGGAGGIFGKYTGSITSSTLINEGEVQSKATPGAGTTEVVGTGGITGVITGDITGSTIINRGTVTNSEYGQNIGGLFGYSSGTITGSTLQNEGSVSGTQNVGGLIGMNTGDISKSNLINTVDGTVSGNQNVGGLIGQNTASVSGGRNEEDENDAADQYYKYKVYNNGVVTGVADDSNQSESVGGLIGYNNRGSLTAAYNTGVVSGGTDVGGVVGRNSGSVDQVFNSVVAVTKAQNEDGTYTYTYSDGSISGDMNVGGIVGYNEKAKDEVGSYIDGTGVVTNAYNTTAVNYSNHGGNIVGKNDHGTVQNVYGYADKAQNGDNVGESLDGAVTNSYVIGTDGKIVNGGDAKDKSSYAGFDFAGSDEKAATWKLYATNTNPLLKVFLTKVNVNDSLYEGLVYNANDQRLVAQWIKDGKLTTAQAEAFNAYFNNNDLINGKELKDAGTYSNWLWSGQIATDKEGAGKKLGPNNLGYDFDIKDITINKKKITINPNDPDPVNPVQPDDKGSSVFDVNGNDVVRTYGTVDGVSYGLNFNYGDDYNDKMKQELEGKITITDEQSTIQNSQDGGVTDSGNRTNNVGGYSWHAGVKLDDSLTSNYEFSTGGSTATVQGNSDVVKANLNVVVDDKEVKKGDSVDFTGRVNGLVNGDTFADIGFGGYDLADGVNPLVVGVYQDKIGVLVGGKLLFVGADDTLANYKLSIDPGTLTVYDNSEPYDSHHDYWFSTAPWDRERNLRERKAEFHYVGGGMNL